MSDALRAAADLVERRGSGALVLALAGPHQWKRALVDAGGSLVAGELPLDEAATSQVVERIAGETSGLMESSMGRLYVEVLAPDPRLLVFGAGPIAEALCAMAARAGFTVEVTDPRAGLAEAARFPDAASVRHAWPDEVLSEAGVDARTFVVSLLHEARFEDRLFPALLESPARYIGALGSRRTHAARVARLRERGVDERAIERIRGPVGLDIGAVTPAEIAVAIMAEMVTVRRGASGRSE